MLFRHGDRVLHILGPADNGVGVAVAVVVVFRVAVLGLGNSSHHEKGIGILTDDNDVINTVRLKALDGYLENILYISNQWYFCNFVEKLSLI